jgi:hypothetical protein
MMDKEILLRTLNEIKETVEGIKMEVLPRGNEVVVALSRGEVPKELQNLLGEATAMTITPFGAIIRWVFPRKTS